MHKAAAADQADAQVMLANYLLRGEPGAEDIAKALTWLERAVASGNRDAKFYLAALLAAGVDPARRDPARALAVLKEVMRDLDDDPTAFEIRAAAYAMLGATPSARPAQCVCAWQRILAGNGVARGRLGAYVASRPWPVICFAF